MRFFCGSGALLGGLVLSLVACQADVFTAGDGAPQDSDAGDASTGDGQIGLLCATSDGGGPWALGYDDTMASLTTMPDTDPEGALEAFSFVATKNDVACAVHLFVDGTSTAKQILLGIYDDEGGQQHLVSTAQITGAMPTMAAWHAAPLDTPVVVKSGQTYWIAVLAPTGSGTVAFRDHDQALDGGAPSRLVESVGSSLPDPLPAGVPGMFSPIEAYLSR